MKDFDQDNQYRDEFLWLDKKKGRASKESKLEEEVKDLRRRVERLERNLEGKRSEDSQDNFKGDSKGTKEVSEARLDAVNEECRVQQAEGFRTSFGEGIL
jgi:predicted RNase H-like nuclease (RuvC/YqgF family)